jgi:type IV pilus assembly protein PilF
MKTTILHLVTGISLLLMGCSVGNVRDNLGTEPQVDHLAELHTQLGFGYLREGKYDTAWKRLRRALEIAPNYPTAHNAMALLYEQLDKPKQSEAHYRRAIELDPADSGARNNYGRFLCNLGRSTEAVEQFLLATENPLYDTPEIAYTNAGLCLYSVGELDKAETYLRRALKRNLEFTPALIKMAELGLETGRPLVARAYLQRYLDNKAHTPHSLWLGIQIERKLGDEAKAEHYAALLESDYPDADETRLLLKIRREN